MNLIVAAAKRILQFWVESTTGLKMGCVQKVSSLVSLRPSLNRKRNINGYNIYCIVIRT